MRAVLNSANLTSADLSHANPTRAPLKFKMTGPT
jgi:uncharacterized protein YjbI with pentapeptide repeats